MIKTYLEMVCLLHGENPCIESFILEHGVQYESQRLTVDEERYIRKCAINCRHDFPMKECWWNSQRMLRKDNEHRLTYVEGFASRIIPVPVLHGWIEINGKVVDMTWPYDWRTDERPKRHRSEILSNKTIGEWKDSRMYYGVRFNREYTLRISGSVISDYKSHLISGLPKDVWGII